jgi:hypothetical protein
MAQVLPRPTNSQRRFIVTIDVSELNSLGCLIIKHIPVSKTSYWEANILFIPHNLLFNNILGHNTYIYIMYYLWYTD